MNTYFKNKLRVILFVIISMSFLDVPPFVKAESTPISTKDGYLDVEIEDMPYNHDFFGIIEDEMFSGGKALKPSSEDKTLPDPTDEAQLDLSFTADKGGTYQLWVRHTAEIINQRGQSVFLSLGNGVYSNFRLTAEPRDPVWIKIGSITVKEGNVGSVRLRRRQSAYIGFDRYIVTKDASFVPSDIDLGITEQQSEGKNFKVKGGQGSCEAEDITIFRNFDLTSSFKMSGETGIKNTGASSASNVSTNQADARFSLTCDEPGTYYVWGYVRGNSSSNIILLSVNGGNYEQISIDNTGGKFQWQKLYVFSSTERNQKNDIRIRVNKGSWEIDKFVFVNDIMKQPYGLLGNLIEKDTKVTNPYADVDIELPQKHPRVYFADGDIERILADKEKDDNVIAWEKLNSYINAGLSENFTGKLSSPQSGKSNANSSTETTIESLAFDYLVNKNVQSGEKAVSAMRNYLEGVVFTGAYSDTYVRGAGQLIFHVAEVYDWCYDLLDKNTKKYFIERCIEIAGDGLEVRWPFNGNGVSGHTAEAQLQRDLLAFSIAVADERPDIFKRMMGVLYENYVPQRKRIYEAHMPNQGSQYGCYRGRWELLAAILMEKIGVHDFYGEDQHYFPYWYLYARRPDGLIFRDGDARIDGRAVGEYFTRPDMMRVMLLSSYLYNDGYLKEEFNRQFGLGKSFAAGHDGMSPVEFICFYRADLETKSSKSLPYTMYFPSPKGAMIARTGWNDGMDSDDVVAYMNLDEYNFGNHDHIDAGHFQLYYKGLLAGDMGGYITYGSAHDRGYFKRSVAHNTLAVRNPQSPVTFQGYTTYDGGQRSPRNGSDMGADVFKTEDAHFAEILGHEFGKDKNKPLYSYLSGNLTKAYNSDTVENYERSFMFYNLQNKEHPAAMVIFDRVTAKNAEYKKAWLLNGQMKPEITENRTVFTNNENGYNGKMVVDTLLPEKNNTEISVIGGEGKDAWVYDKNYPQGAELDPTLVHESVGYRIEVSPKNAADKDYFLNVIQVGDADSSADPLTPTIIKNESCIGAKLNDTVTIFKTGYGRSKETVNFSLDDGNYKISVCDNTEGEWSVKKDGNEIMTISASKDGGVLFFEGTGGEYIIEYKDDKVQEEIAAEISDDSAAYKNDVGTRIYNNYIYSPTLAKEFDGNVYVPLKAITQKLGGEVSWENGAAIVKYENETIEIVPESDVATVNGISETMPYKAMIVDGTMLVSPALISKYMFTEWKYDPVVKIVQFKSYKRGNTRDINNQLCFDNKHKEIENSLTVYAVLQSDSDGNNIENSIDGNFDTRWAVQGTRSNPAWGIYDFGNVKQLDTLYLAFMQGASRKAYFRIEASEDGNKFFTVIENAESSGETDEFDSYDLGGVKARYLKIYGYGNNSSASASWNSITEFAVAGR